MSNSNAGRKVRPDAVLRQLPEDRQQLIFEELKKKSYADVQKWLKADGLSVGTTALQEFYQFWCSEVFFAQAESARQIMVDRLMTTRPGITLEEATEQGDAAFLMTAAAVGDLKGYMPIRKVLVAERKTALESRRVSILEKKAAKLDELEASLKERKGRGGISPETLEVIESTLGMI